MAIAGMVIIGIGGITAFVGGIMVLIAAFKESAIWGVLSLLVPFASLVYIFTHWEDAKQGFLISLAGSVAYGIGMGLMIAGGGKLPGMTP